MRIEFEIFILEVFLHMRSLIGMSQNPIKYIYFLYSIIINPKSLQCLNTFLFLYANNPDGGSNIFLYSYIINPKDKS